jgi:hypothetical protein
MKMNLVCEEWRSVRKNTLLGFAQIRIQELHLVVRDIAVHEKSGRRWAQLPARPQIKDGRVITDAAGKVQYFSLLSFEGRDVADAFSDAVCAAILRKDAHAFDTPNAERATSANERLPVSAEIPF